MKQKSKAVFPILILVSLMMIHCGSFGRGNQIVETGEIESSTNNLVASQNLDLFLDQIRFEGHLGSDALYNEHPDFEVHLMNKDESRLLACVGTAQKSTLGQMGEGIITYAHIGAQFLADGAHELEADTEVVVRLIEKRSGSYCPTGYVGSDAIDTSSRDLVLAKKSVIFGDLTTQLIIFNHVASVGLTTAVQAPWPVEAQESVDDGVLAADQINLEEGLEFGELSAPELALMLHEAGEETPVACTDLHDVDADGLLYATLTYDFIDADDRDVRLEDLDAGLDYQVRLVEIDQGDCRDLLEGEFGIGVSVFGTTDEVSLDELIDGILPLNDEGDYIRLITR